MVMERRMAITTINVSIAFVFTSKTFTHSSIPTKIKDKIKTAINWRSTKRNAVT